MQWIAFSKFCIHLLNEQAISLYHYLWVAGLHAKHNIVVAFIAGNTEKLHGTFYHAHWRVSIAAHNPVAKAAVVGADAHSGAVLLADAYQGGKACTDAVYFFRIVSVRIFNQFKLLLINIVAGIDTYFFYNTRRYFSGIGCKVNICHQWCSIATAA